MILAGRYRVIRRLGSGGMATVFLAEDERLGREIALKRLHAESPERDAARLRREARIGASLKHPNLVTVFGIEADPEGILVVMEYVEGETLADALRRSPLPAGEALAILHQVAAGLDHAHAAGIVHRDVKPANILLAHDGTVKVADLGIAHGAEFTRVTQANAVVGTPAYMAPEQLDGKPAERAADVYALASVAFQMLTGRKPRTGAGPLALARAMREPPPDLRDELPDAPPGAAAALKRGMALDPAARPVSASAFVDELEDGLAEEPAARAPVASPTAGRRRRAPLFVVLALLGLVAAGVLAAVLASGGSSPKASSDRAATAKRSTSTGRNPTAGGGSGAATPTPTSGGGAAADPSTPDGAVRAFYERAAAGDPAGSFELATPAAQQQVGGLDSFSSATSTLRKITFEELTADGSTVTLRTVAEHSDRTDRCQGTATTVRDGDRYLVDRLNVQCSSS